MGGLSHVHGSATINLRLAALQHRSLPKARLKMKERTGRGGGGDFNLGSTGAKKLASPFLAATWVVAAALGCICNQ